MNTTPTSTKPKMTTLATLITFGMFVAGCGGGGGGATGSQSVTPSSSTTTKTTAGEAASGAASAGAVAAAEAAAPGVSDPSAAINAAKAGESTSSPSAAKRTGAMATTPSPALTPDTSPSTKPTPATIDQSSSNTPTSTTGQAASPSPAPTPSAAPEMATAKVEPNTTGAAMAVASKATERLARVQSAATDMALAHEVKPAGAPTTGWGVASLVVMGTEPYGKSIPSNWIGTRYENWKSMLTWFVIYEGTGGNKATNTAVEVYGIELWYLSTKDKVWKKVQSDKYPEWNGAYDLKAVAASTTAATFAAVTQTVARFAPTATNIIHGGLNQTNTPWNPTTDKADISALYASVKHRLVLKSAGGVDDRAVANYVVQTGIDYYPYIGARVKDLNATYMPGAGSGRFLKATTNWRYSTVLLKAKGMTDAALFDIPAPTFDF